MRRIVITALATLCLAACNNPSSAATDQTAAENAVAEPVAANEAEIEPARIEARTESQGELITQVEGGLTATRAANGGAMALPDDFPDDVYLPDEYEVTTTTESADGRSVYFKADGDVKPLFDAASLGMQEKGWTVMPMEAYSPDTRTLMFAKGQRTGGISVINTDEPGLVLMVHFDNPCGKSISRLGATGPAVACPEDN